MVDSSEGMGKTWMYNDRGNERRRTLKVINEFLGNKLEKDGMVDVMTSACVDESGY